MLSFQKSVPLGYIFVIFYGIDIYSSKFPYIVSERLYLLLHIGKICEIHVTQFHRVIIGDLILLPHVVHLLFRGRFVGFFLAVQPETFFVQRRDMFGQIFPHFQEITVFLIQFIALSALCFDLFADLIVQFFGILDRLP